MRRILRTLFVSSALAAIATWPAAWGATGRPAPDSEFGETNRLQTLGGVWVLLCHIPPGHPEEQESIYVPEAEVPEHLAHGDYLGECRLDCDGAPSPMAATGQTWCTTEAGAHISCSGTGQDGELLKGVTVSTRFRDNGDGTVKDYLTGLVWLKNADCFGTQKWTNGLKLSNMLAHGQCGLTDNSIAGDWRLPNIRELSSLIDFQQSFPALPPSHPFLNVSYGYAYWASTSDALSTAYARYVFFAFADIYVYDKTDPDNLHVWSVRDAHDPPCYGSEMK